MVEKLKNHLGHVKFAFFETLQKRFDESRFYKCAYIFYQNLVFVD